MCDMEKYFNIAGPCFPGEHYMHPVFDEGKAKSWNEKLYLRDEIVDGKAIHVVGL